jgi:hypothetical protein
MHRMRAFFLAVPAALTLCAGLTACSPALDWREIRPEDSGAVAMFPCKPTTHARKVQLAGGEVLLTLYACLSAATNIGAGAPRTLPLAVEGATPSTAAGRVALEGKRKDGAAVQEQVAVFAKGTRVFQATAIGARLPAEGLEIFFDGLRTP